MDYKMAFLLNEGFSINTITNMDSRQLGLIYEKIKKVSKEPKEAVTKTTTSTTYSKDEAKGKTFSKEEGVNVTINKDDSVTVTKEGEVTEKSVSRKQQKAMGIALAAKKGDIPKEKLKGSSKEMVKMSKSDLEDFASTKHKGLPEKKTKKDVKKLEENILKIVENYLYSSITKKDLLTTIKKYK